MVNSLLDLDLDLGGDSVPPKVAAGPMTMDFTVPEVPPLKDAQDSTMDFKLDDLDFDQSTQNQRLSEDSTARMGLSDGDLGQVTSPGKLGGPDSLIDAVHDLANDDSDPLTRQLELAEEFRQIGDVEGARDVLQELMSQVTSGPLFDKAKAMLEKLR